MNIDTKKKVLIIDDEYDVVRYLSMVLKDAGFEVETAYDGNEGLEKLKGTKPDLISLDIVMPKGSGVKFHRAIKKHPEWSKIPVMVVTGHARDELGKADFSEMTMSGPGVYLEKPVNAKNYIESVEKILGLESPALDEKGELKAEVQQLLETADGEMLEEIKKMIQKNKGK